MPQKPYDPVGAMGGLFSPAYIHGNPESEAAVQQWQAENHAVTPAMIEASRGPDTIITNPAVGGLGIRGRGDSTTTVQGSVDPEALRIYAQGGKYTPAAAPVAAGGGGGDTSAAAPVVTPAVNMQRDAITGAMLGAGRTPNATAGSLIRAPTGAPPVGYQYADSPLIGLMGEGDNTSFMQGGWAGGA